MHADIRFGDLCINCFFVPMDSIVVLKLFDPEPVDTIFEFSLFGIGFGIYWIGDLGDES